MKDYRYPSKKPQEKPQEKPLEKKRTVSHLMVFIILSVYIIIIFSGLGLTAWCLSIELPDVASTVFIALLSYSGVCGSSTIIMYVTKAMKENEIKISNDLYRMKLELAKDIYKALSNNTLSEKAITLIAYLIGENNSNNNNPLSTLLSNSTSNLNIPLKTSDDGLG